MYDNNVWLLRVWNNVTLLLFLNLQKSIHGYWELNVTNLKWLKLLLFILSSIFFNQLEKIVFIGV